MSAKQYHVHLTVEERHGLEQLLRRGTHPVRKLTRARILLKADEGLRDEEIAEVVETSVPTIERTRRRFGEVRLATQSERSRPGNQPRLDEGGEARLIAEACSKAPGGAGAADDATVSGSGDRVAIGRVLLEGHGVAGTQKNELKPWGKQQWCLPEVTGAFVAAMEEVLALYAEPYDPQRPKICFDENQSPNDGGRARASPVQPRQACAGGLYLSAPRHPQPLPAS